VKVWDVNNEDLNKMRKATWEEECKGLWGGSPPKIEILYDELNSFLWEVSFVIDTKRTAFREEELLETFFSLYEKQGIWRPDDQPDTTIAAVAGDEKEPPLAQQEPTATQQAPFLPPLSSSSMGKDLQSLNNDGATKTVAA